MPPSGTAAMLTFLARTVDVSVVALIFVAFS
jgi:hypothetical protein